MSNQQPQAPTSNLAEALVASGLVKNVKIPQPERLTNSTNNISEPVITNVPAPIISVPNHLTQTKTKRAQSNLDFVNVTSQRGQNQIKLAPIENIYVDRQTNAPLPKLKLKPEGSGLRSEAPLSDLSFFHEKPQKKESTELTNEEILRSIPSNEPITFPRTMLVASTIGKPQIASRANYENLNSLLQHLVSQIELDPNSTDEEKIVAQRDAFNTVMSEIVRQGFYECSEKGDLFNNMRTYMNQTADQIPVLTNKLQKVREAAQNQIAALKSENEDLEKKNETLFAKYNSLEKDQNRLQSRLKFAEEKIPQLEENTRLLRLKNQESEIKVSETLKKLEKVKEKKTKMKKSNVENQSIIEEMGKQVQNLLDFKEKAQDTVFLLTDENDRLKKINIELKKEIETLREATNELAKKLEQTVKESKKNSNRINEQTQTAFFSKQPNYGGNNRYNNNKNNGKMNSSSNDGMERGRSRNQLSYRNAMESDTESSDDDDSYYSYYEDDENISNRTTGTTSSTTKSTPKSSKINNNNNNNNKKTPHKESNAKNNNKVSDSGNDKSDISNNDYNESVDSGNESETTNEAENNQTEEQGPTKSRPTKSSHQNKKKDKKSPSKTKEKTTTAKKPTTKPDSASNKNNSNGIQINNDTDQNYEDNENANEEENSDNDKETDESNENTKETDNSKDEDNGNDNNASKPVHKRRKKHKNKNKNVTVQEIRELKKDFDACQEFVGDITLDSFKKLKERILSRNGRFVPNTENLMRAQDGTFNIIREDETVPPSEGFHDTLRMFVHSLMNRVMDKSCFTVFFSTIGIQSTEAELMSEEEGCNKNDFSNTSNLRLPSNSMSQSHCVIPTTRTMLVDRETMCFQHELMRDEFGDNFTKLLDPAYSDRPPRSFEWLVKSIKSIYDEKTVKDTKDYSDMAKMGNGGSSSLFKAISMPLFALQWSMRQYGLEYLAHQCCWDLVNTARAHQSKAADVETFRKFLDEDFTTTQLTFFLRMRTICMRRGITLPVSIFVDDNADNEGNSEGNSNNSVVYNQVFLTLSIAIEIIQKVFQKAGQEAVDAAVRAVRHDIVRKPSPKADTSVTYVSMISLLNHSIEAFQNFELNELRKLMKCCSVKPKLDNKGFRQLVRELVPSANDQNVAELYRLMLSQPAESDSTIEKVVLSKKKFIEKFYSKSLLSKENTEEIFDIEKFYSSSPEFESVKEKWKSLLPLFDDALEDAEKREKDPSLSHEMQCLKLDIDNVNTSLTCFDVFGAHKNILTCLIQYQELVWTFKTPEIELMDETTNSIMNILKI